MNDLVLVDTSAWIEASRPAGDPETTQKLQRLIDTGLTAMCAPVWMELYQGARGKREEQQLESWRLLSKWLEFDADCWREAAQTARMCLRSGVTVPFGDLLVDACARRHKVELLECDRHFPMIAKAVRQ